MSPALRQVFVLQSRYGPDGLWRDCSLPSLLLEGKRRTRRLDTTVEDLFVSFKSSKLIPLGRLGMAAQHELQSIAHSQALHNYL